MTPRYEPLHAENVTRSAYWPLVRSGRARLRNGPKAAKLFSSVHHLHELHPAVDADFRVDAVRVVLDGLQADEQLLCDLLVRLAETDLLHDLPLALRDAVLIEDVLQTLLCRVLGLDGREHAVVVRAQVKQRR